MKGTIWAVLGLLSCSTPASNPLEGKPATDGPGPTIDPATPPSGDTGDTDTVDDTGVPPSTTDTGTPPTPASCGDACLLGAIHPDGTQVCDLWDDLAQDWTPMGDGSVSLHHRARHYETWLRAHMMPAGGVANARFTDDTWTEVDRWIGTGDSAIWTGTYLAAESLRALATGSDDAKEQVDATVRTLHDWFNVSGEPGYLTRYAAPSSSDPGVLAAFVDEPHAFTAEYEGEEWTYQGHISRDQYQGVMLGYALAFEATDDPAIKELIRADVVELVEELMLERTLTFHLDIDGTSLPLNLDVQYVVRTTQETLSGDPEIVIDTVDVDDSVMDGFQEFDPDFYNNLTDQVFLLSWLPNIPRSGSAIMLASFFEVALKVTDGEAAYTTRRQAILDHYTANVSDWLDVAVNPIGFTARPCGDKYYSHNIRFEPMYNLARLASAPTGLQRIQDDVLHSQMWEPIADHNNVWFAFIYAASMPASPEVDTIVAAHASQLEGFPNAPRVRTAIDNAPAYGLDPACPGNVLTPTDVSERPLEDFLWQRHPFEAVDYDDAADMRPGVDYMAAYWLGRHEGFLSDDTPDQCLQWRPL